MSIAFHSNLFTTLMMNLKSYYVILEISSKIAFFPEWTDLIIEYSTKVSRISLTCHMSDKAFGPVGYSVNSISTGIPLSCYMGLH